MTTPVRRFADVVPQLWRNGLGTTSELVDDNLARSLLPAPAWRLSVASLSEPAPFSVFPGRSRTLIAWGGGVVLDIDGEPHRLRAGEALRFPGSATTRLVGLDAPCYAMNLLASGSRPALVSADAGARFDSPVVALLGNETDEFGRFDALLIRAGEEMPAAGAVVHPRGDEALQSRHPGS